MNRNFNGTAKNLQQILQAQIPLSKQMGIQVRSSCAARVQFALPLKPNRNHKMTAFGGTLIAAQALASWSLLMELLSRHKLQAEVVLQRERSEFHRPVTTDFVVTTCPLSSADVARFLQTLQRHRKARIEIAAQVTCRRKLTCEFIGEYVAIASRQS